MRSALGRRAGHREANWRWPRRPRACGPSLVVEGGAVRRISRIVDGRPRHLRRESDRARSGICGSHRATPAPLVAWDPVRADTAAAARRPRRDPAFELVLAPFASVFVLPGCGAGGPAATTAHLPLDGDWRLRVPGGEDVATSPDPTLWTDARRRSRADSPAQRSTATTSTSPTTACPARRQRWSSGVVRDIARVVLNGMDCGIVWTAPFGSTSRLPCVPGRTTSRCTWRPRGATASSPRQHARPVEIFAPMTEVFEASADPLPAGLLGPVHAVDSAAEGRFDADQLSLLPHISDRYVEMMQMVPQWFYGPRAAVSCTAGDNDVTKGSKCHSSPPTAPAVVASCAPRGRRPGPRRLFRLSRRRRRQPPMRRRRHRLLDHGRRRPTTPTTTTRRSRQQYTEETGVEIEVIPYPSEAYNTQVTTQLQAGQRRRHDDPLSRHRASRSRSSPSPRPASSSRSTRPPPVSSPRAARAHVPGRRRDVRAADGAHARRHGLQRHRRPKRSASSYPETYEDLLDACTDCARWRQDLHRPRRRHPVQHRAVLHARSRRPASTRRRRTGTSSAPPAM